MKKSPLVTTLFWIGMAFLYFPIAVLITYSFNASRLVTVWSGFSTRWYTTLLHDQALLQAAWLSIRLAISASSIALILGTMIAVALTRFGPFRSRRLLYGLTLTPLVMPDIITGIALLFVFISLKHLIHWPSVMSFPTMLIAHVTFCTAYASIALQARLASLDTSTHEAAMDLGARPTKTFFQITLPQIIPSLIAAWLLSFTLSIDDLIITSFVSGPGSTTLPMMIFSIVKTGVTPEINALATVMICIVLTTVGSTLFISNRRVRSKITHNAEKKPELTDK